jgi:hypothetical protein
MLVRAGELGGGVDCGDALVGVACEICLVWHAITGLKEISLKEHDARTCASASELFCARRDFDDPHSEHGQAPR